MAADLSGVDEKVQRAKEHVAQLERRIDAFEQTEPYALVRQPDPDDPQKIQGILQIHKPIPAAIPVVLGDVVHNLRAALDYLACAAVGSKITKDTAFPIWRAPRTPSPKDYKALVGGKVKGAPQPFIDLLLTLQPYEGGQHEALWAVDYLDITDKHRLLISVPATYREHVTTVGPFSMTMTLDEPQFPLKDGDVLVEMPAESQQQEQPAIDVALGEPGPLAGEPLVPALTQLVEATTSVIDTLRKSL